MAAEITPYGPAWEDELALLFEALPPTIAESVGQLAQVRGDLLEVVLDLGREPEARFVAGESILDNAQVTPDDLDYVVTRVGIFGKDNRAGIERTLHRISAIRNRAGRIVGLTCRVGRAVTGTIDIIKDIVVDGRSLLLLGAPGIGKTTMLRECARVLSDDCGKRVVIVDTSNEIGGDGDIPHPGIGRSRRMQVPTPELQHAVMIEAVENHMPQVIVIDEIGTELEAAAARTIAERGVQLVGTAHGTNLENLLVNPTLNDLLGGIQSVTLSDEEARRRGTQKSVLERKAPPTFDVLVELQERTRVVVHVPLDETVDEALRGRIKPAQLRMRDAAGNVVTRREVPDTRESIFESAPFGNGDRGGQRERNQSRSARAANETSRKSSFPRLQNSAPSLSLFSGSDETETPRSNRTSTPISVFPYGVSRNYVEQSIRDLHVPVRIQHHVEDADIVITLKNYYRRKDSPMRTAEARGIPIHVLRSNTIAQIKDALSHVYGTDDRELTAQALQDATDGIARARKTGEDVKLAPQSAQIRRLQHQLIESQAMTSRSTGNEPNRHLVISAPEAS